jgi:uncharacterized membrane protein
MICNSNQNSFNMVTTNRKRANRITLGILGLLITIIVITLIFPVHSLGFILITGAIVGLYYVSKKLRNLIEDTLDEFDENNKWKQDRNIK